MILTTTAPSLVLLAAAAALSPRPAAVPPALTEVNPLLALRWRSVPVHASGGRRDADLIAADQVTEAQLGGQAVLRIHGDFVAGCAPLASRRFRPIDSPGAAAGDRDAWLDVALPGVPSSAPHGHDRLVVLPPVMAADLGEGSVPAQVGLTLPAGCAPVRAQLFEAGDDPDPIAARRVIDELRALGQPVARARRGDDVLALWLRTPSPHLFQEQAALALALPRLLGHEDSAAVADLASAWLELATTPLRTQEASYTLMAPLVIAGASRTVPGDDDSWAVLAPGQSIELPVAELDSIRLVHRSGADPGGIVSAWRVRVGFDEDRERSLLAFAPMDAAAPELSRARSHTLSIPPGARRMRVRALDRTLFIQAVGLRPKPFVRDLFAARTPARLLEAARDRASVHDGGWVGRLAAALLPGARPVGFVAPRTVTDVMPAALLAVLQAQRTPDLKEARRLLDLVAPLLRAVQSPLDRAAAAVIERMAVRLRAELAIDAGNAAEALTLLLQLAARDPLCDEDALVLLDADAFAQESLTGSPQALLAIDGLLARRPLDRVLALGRQRAFAAAARWQEMSIEPGPREVAFFDPLPAQSGPVAPEHSLFAPLPPGAEQTVLLPKPPLPGQMPMLSLVALRGAGGPAAVRVRVDDTAFTVPAVGPFERIDLPMRPGRHRVRLEGAAEHVVVNTNWVNGGARVRRWRRYIQVGEAPLELRNRDVGPSDLLLVAVRAVGPAGRAIGPFELRLEGDAMKPISLRVHPAPAPAVGLPSGDLDADAVVGDSLEALIPVAGANPSYRIAVVHAPPHVRVLVHVSARRRRPAATPAEPSREVRASIARALARDEANLEAVAAASRRLARDPEDHATEYLARAVALTGLDEPTLAREDLVRAIARGSLEPAARGLALTIWRHLENVASSSSPATVDGRSAWVYAPGSGFATEAIPRGAALARLLDDRPALRRLDPEALASAAGGGKAGDFAQLAAARQAERDGDGVRAARLWQQLAVARSAPGLYARAGSALLALAPDPLRDARAYVALFEATRRDPHDPVAARLLRRASGRTRLRPIREVADSAGAVSVDRAAADQIISTVEGALLPADETAPGDLVTADSQLTLSFDLATPMALRLSAVARELRPEGARAVGRSAIALEWARDGQSPHRVPCPGQDKELTACKSGPVALPAGAHSLIVRLRGGLRPAGRVSVASEPLFGPGHGGRAPVERSAEYLVARHLQPIVVTLFGPAVIQAELRAPPGAGPLAVDLLLSSGAAAAAATHVALPGSEAESAPRPPRARQLVALRGPGAAASAPPAPVVQALVLERDQSYRLEIHPDHGAVFCRLSARDGAGGDATRPAPVPATLLAAGPPPRLPPPDLERALLARVDDGDVSLGWDDFGALTAEVGWRSAVDRTEQSGDVVARGAGVASVTYRRLIETLHLTLKLGAEARRWQAGPASQAGKLAAYFVHPAARWARVVAEIDGATQSVEGGRARALQGVLMFEPILTLRSGVHLVSKLGARVHAQSLHRLVDSQLGHIDPDVYSVRAERDPRALFWEEGVELAPLADLLLYGGARVTSNAWSLAHPDHTSASAVARTAVGRLFLEAGLRWSWFFADADRRQTLLLRTVALTASQTFWSGQRHAVTIGLQAAEHIDLRVPEVSLGLAWEFSNGRRLRDHTPVEGENYFYPQRGPGRETGRLVVGGGTP